MEFCWFSPCCLFWVRKQSEIIILMNDWQIIHWLEFVKCIEYYFVPVIADIYQISDVCLSKNSAALYHFENQFNSLKLKRNDGSPLSGQILQRLILCIHISWTACLKFYESFYWEGRVRVPDLLSVETIQMGFQKIALILIRPIHFQYMSCWWGEHWMCLPSFKN